jgi:hypothetical protein
MKGDKKGLTLRNLNYKNNKNRIKNFSQNNPVYKSIVPVERTPTVTLNSLRAKRRNNNQTYLVKKMQPAPKYAIEAFKHSAVRRTRRNNINKQQVPNKLYPTAFNRSVNKHNVLQEANIQRMSISDLNSNSIRKPTNNSSNSSNSSNRHSINSRSTINTNSITNYRNPGIKYIRGITYKNKNPQKNITRFGKNNRIESWKGQLNNNDNKSISSYNEEMWTNLNLNE